MAKGNQEPQLIYQIASFETKMYLKITKRYNLLGWPTSSPEEGFGQGFILHYAFYDVILPFQAISVETIGKASIKNPCSFY